MPLHLKYRAATGLPVDLSGLLPEWTRDKSRSQIERFEVFRGNQKLPLAELFDVSGDPDDGAIHFEGDLSGVHRVGAGMAAGTIRVDGPIGRHGGAEMRGGRLEVLGSAGDWLVAEMQGGQIHVHGPVGDSAAAAYAGSRRGMVGGEVFIHGDTGHELGHRMRRGLVAVGGSAGDSAGMRLIAGTILVLGDCGQHAGAGMRRGTIALSGRSPRLLPTFRRANRFGPQFIRLLLLHCRRQGLAVPEELLGADYVIHHGDFLSLGKGEILTRG